MPYVAVGPTQDMWNELEKKLIDAQAKIRELDKRVAALEALSRQPAPNAPLAVEDNPIAPKAKK